MNYVSIIFLAVLYVLASSKGVVASGLSGDYLQNSADSSRLFDIDISRNEMLTNDFEHPKLNNQVIQDSGNVGTQTSSHEKDEIEGGDTYSRFFLYLFYGFLLIGLLFVLSLDESGKVRSQRKSIQS